jgi:uncharacterized membrane protein
MKEYYKEKLANLREIFRGAILFFITLLSGVTYLFVNLFIDKFKWVEFILVTIGYILLILTFIFLIKLYKTISGITEKLKD